MNLISDGCCFDSIFSPPKACKKFSSIRHYRLWDDYGEVGGERKVEPNIPGGPLYRSPPPKKKKKSGMGEGVACLKPAGVACFVNYIAVFLRILYCLLAFIILFLCILIYFVGFCYISASQFTTEHALLS